MSDPLADIMSACGEARARRNRTDQQLLLLLRIARQAMKVAERWRLMADLDLYELRDRLNAYRTFSEGKGVDIDIMADVQRPPASEPPHAPRSTPTEPEGSPA